VGPAEGESTCRQGKAGPGAAWATPAASRAAALRRGRPRRPVRAPDQARTGEPAATTARAGGRANRPAAASTRATTSSRGSARGRSKRWHLRGLGRSALPKPPERNAGCLPEPIKSAYGVPSGSATPPLDRTRPTRRQSRRVQQQDCPHCAARGKLPGTVSTRRRAKAQETPPCRSMPTRGAPSGHAQQVSGGPARPLVGGSSCELWPRSRFRSSPVARRSRTGV
jgi:hypothetical protein